MIDLVIQLISLVSIVLCLFLLFTLIRESINEIFLPKHADSIGPFAVTVPAIGLILNLLLVIISQFQKPRKRKDYNKALGVNSEQLRSPESSSST
jgi:predicted histidine transporter YuiF (NhaC family)